MTTKTKLTVQFLERLKSRGHPYYVSDQLAVGLRVRVAASGTLSWNVAYRIKGESKPTSVSLGTCDPSGKEGRTLAEARERAAEIVKAAREGRNLIWEEEEAKALQKEAMTVQSLTEAYGKSIKSSMRSGGPLRTAEDIERRLKRGLKEHLFKTADKLRRADISRMLDELAEQFPREAEKRRQTIGAMYRWGISKGYVTTDPTAGSEAYGRGDPRERTLDENEIRSVWQWLKEGAGKMPPDCIEVLKLQLCVGARVSEVGGIAAEELSEQDGRLIWTLPPERSKNKRARILPLIGEAKKIIEAARMRRKRGPLFRTSTDRALNSVDLGHTIKKRPLPCADFNTHDLRRTVVAKMDEIGVSLDTIAIIVGHQRGSKDVRTLVRHYAQNYPIERIEVALKLWDARLLEIVSGNQADDNVIAFSIAERN